MKRTKPTDDDLAKIEEELRKEKSKKPMKVSGKSVFKIQEIIQKKSDEE